MTRWRWVFVVVGLAAFVVTAVLIAVDSPSAARIANGFWAFVAVGALVQLVRSSRSTGHPSKAVSPGTQGLGEAEDTVGPTAPDDTDSSSSHSAASGR